MPFIYTYEEHATERLVHQNKSVTPNISRPGFLKYSFTQNESNHLSDYMVISSTHFYQYLYKIPHLLLFT